MRPKSQPAHRPFRVLVDADGMLRTDGGDLCRVAFEKEKIEASLNDDRSISLPDDAKRRLCIDESSGLTRRKASLMRERQPSDHPLLKQHQRKDRPSLDAFRVMVGQDGILRTDAGDPCRQATHDEIVEASWSHDGHIVTPEDALLRLRVDDAGLTRRK